MIRLAAAFLLLAPATAEAQEAPCLDVRDFREQSFTGTLSTQLFAGPPGLESISAGDAPHWTMILTLPEPICVNDGGEHADPARRFVSVQVGAAEDRLLPRLHAAVGQRVEVRGEAFPAHTGYHHAPLVMLAKEVRVVAP